MKDRPGLVLFPLRVGTVPRARIVPRAVSQRYQAHVCAAAYVCPDMVHNLAVEDTAVRIEERLLQAVHEDAMRRGFYANLRVDHVVIDQGNEYIASVRGVVARVHPDTSKEAAAGVCEPEDKEDERCRQGNVYAILDGRENGYEHRSRPNKEFEW